MSVRHRTQNFNTFLLFKNYNGKNKNTTANETGTCIYIISMNSFGGRINPENNEDTERCVNYEQMMRRSRMISHKAEIFTEI